MVEKYLLIRKLKELYWENVYLCSNVNDAWVCFKQMFLRTSEGSDQVPSFLGRD